jgi:hypothetical protein
MAAKTRWWAAGMSSMPMVSAPMAGVLVAVALIGSRQQHRARRGRSEFVDGRELLYAER